LYYLRWGVVDIGFDTTMGAWLGEPMVTSGNGVPVGKFDDDIESLQVEVPVPEPTTKRWRTVVVRVSSMILLSAPTSVGG
jgi:hypothetical protein